MKWINSDISPQKDGSYFCKVTTESGYLDGNGFHKINNKVHHAQYSVTFENGGWLLGSSLLFGAKVVEWLDHNSESNYISEIINEAYNQAIDDAIKVVAIQRPPEPTTEDELTEEIILQLHSLKK